MLKSVLALLITIFTLSVFCYSSEAYYARSCFGYRKTVPISHHKEIAENSSASSIERMSAIRCLREYGAEGARILCGLLERDFGNNDMMNCILNSLGEIRDRSVIVALHRFIERIDADLDSTQLSSVPLEYNVLGYKGQAIGILAKLALSAYDEPSGWHPLTPAGRNDDGTVSIVICGGIAWYRQYESVGIRPRQSDARMIIEYLTKIKNTKPRTQKEASIVKTASEGLELIEYRIALLNEYGPRLIRRETASKDGWKTTLYLKDGAHNINDLLKYDEFCDALASEIEGVLASESVDSLITALNDTSEEVRRRTVVLLGLSRHPNAIPAIYKSLRNDPSLEVRMQTADSLGRLAGEKAVPALKEAIANDSRIARGVISGLGHAGGAGVPLLIKMLKHEINNPPGESHIADLIVHSLKNTGDRRAIQPLIELMSRPADFNNYWASTQEMAAQVLTRFAIRKHYSNTLYCRRSTAEGIAITPVAKYQANQGDIEQIIAAVENAGYDIGKLENSRTDLELYNITNPGELNTQYGNSE